MRNITIDRLPKVTDSTAVAFLTEAYTALQHFEEMYKYLRENLTATHDTELAEMGITHEDDIMYHMDEYIGQLQTDVMDYATKFSQFGEGSIVGQIAKAVANVEMYQADILTRVSLATPMTVEEIQRMLPYYKFVIGDLAFTLGSITHVDDILEAVLAREEISVDGALKAFCTSRNITLTDLALYIGTVRKHFPSVIPVFDECPEEWDEICAKLNPSMISEIIDYGDQVYLVDIKAYRHGDLLLDENYVAMLEERQTTPPSIAEDFPDSWNVFQHAMPEEFALRVINILPKILHGFVSPILQGQPFTAKYMEFLEKVCGGGLNEEDFDHSEDSAKSTEPSMQDKMAAEKLSRYFN
ncbi:MAG: hypothetical protein RSC43_00875 [Clostridia bacterium]